MTKRNLDAPPAGAPPAEAPAAGRRRQGSLAGDALDRPERTRSRTRQRVLDAAARIFREQGYGARLADIAEEAGMQAGSLYYHFDSREALIEEVLRLGLDQAWEHVNATLAAAPAGTTPGERLVIALRAHLAGILDHSDYTAANSRIFSMADEEIRERHSREQQRYGDFFHGLLAEAIETGELRSDVDPAVVRMLLFGAMNWTAEWYRPDRGRPASLVIDQLMALVTEGLWQGPPPTRA